MCLGMWQCAGNVPELLFSICLNLGEQFGSQSSNAQLKIFLT